MALEQRTEKLKECPICGYELEHNLLGATCWQCKQHFEYDVTHNIWKGKYILDIAYLDPETSCLSNLFHHRFRIRTGNGFFEFASIEAFLRCLCLNEETQAAIREISVLSGYDAWRVRYALPDWRKSQKLFWDGKYYERESEEYKKLLEMAYDSLFDSSVVFRMALEKSKGKVLMHTLGENAPQKTLITQKEYISLLLRERKRL